MRRAPGCGDRRPPPELAPPARRSSAPRPAPRCPPLLAGGCACKSEEGRHRGWANEYDEARRLRTEDFYARRKARLEAGAQVRVNGVWVAAPRPLAMRREGVGVAVVAATVVAAAAYAMPARAGSSAAVAAASTLARIAGTNMTVL